MNNHVLKAGRKQRGVAAVELALILPLLVLLLALTLFFGRYFWHYTVAQKAAHDAVIMLATATKLEIATKTPDFSVVEIANVARAMAEEEVAELNPGRGRPYIEVYCDDLVCLGEVVPRQLKVAIRMNVTDMFFGGSMAELVGSDGLIVRAEVRMPYVGN